jgi:membrane protein DedA with SNARE-associated domain
MWHSLAQLASFSDPVQYFESISYLGVFVAVGLSGHVLPLPEDAIMLLTGYIAALGIVKLPNVIAVAIVAILFADFCLYYVSYTGARIATKIEARIKANIFSWYADRMRKHAFRFVFISRFVPGLRFVGPVIAGYIKIRPLTFFLYSCCSAFIYVPTVITIGYIFDQKITPLLGVVESTRHIIFAVLLAVLTIGLVVWAYRKFFISRIGRDIV